MSSSHGLDLILRGLANSRKMHLDPEGIDLESWEDLLEASEPCDLASMTEAMTSDGRGTGRIFVDLTASEAVPKQYVDLLEHDVAVVSANKLPFSSDRAVERRLHTLGRGAPRRLFHETTVGAGLPILGPLEELVATGDRIQRIAGVLSGTMSFLLSSLRKGEAMSHAITQAHEAGYTEPDPRDDLSGEDAARKLVILGREAGFEISRKDIEVTAALPSEEWRDYELDDFWRHLPEIDGHFDDLMAKAQEEDRELVHLAELGPNGGSVRIESVDRNHPAAGVLGRDNVIAIWTKRYGQHPLVVRGAGAGREVTAAGVLADVIEAATRPV